MRRSQAVQCVAEFRALTAALELAACSEGLPLDLAGIVVRLHQLEIRVRSVQTPGQCAAVVRAVLDLCRDAQVQVSEARARLN